MKVIGIIGGFLFGVLGRILVWLAKQLARLIAYLAVQAVMHPRSSASVVVCAAGVTVLGWQLFLSIVGGAYATLSTWKAAHPLSFESTVGTWARSWWSRWWIYRRNWTENFTLCGLTVQAKNKTFVPTLKAVRSTPYWDHLLVEMRKGQALSHFVKQADELRTAFEAERIVVNEVKPRGLTLAFMRRDPLLDGVPATAIPASVEAIDWRAVPVGLNEFGEPFAVNLLAEHIAVAGSTGGGKASLEWNVLRAVAPGIVAGLVRPVLIDPKVMELSKGRKVAADEDYVGEGTPEDELPEVTEAFLKRLVAELGVAKAAAAAAGLRNFTPTKGRPLTLIIIDELAPLLKYWPRRIRDRIEELLGILLTQGRAAGFIVLGAIQEPTKDVFDLRDLFTMRIGLRLPSPTNTDAALIDDAVKFGALCHEIPKSLPGVFYSLQDGAKSTVRARFGHVRDEDIDELVAYVEGARKVVNLDTWGAGKTEIENAA